MANLKEKMAAKKDDNNDEPVLEFLNNTIEQMTIFQNKDALTFKNIRLSKIKREGEALTDSDEDEHTKKQIEGINKKYVKKLEITIDNLNGKLTKAKKELELVKQENLSLQASIDNHVYINEKLNQAYKSLKDKSSKGKSSSQAPKKKVMDGKLELNLDNQDSGDIIDKDQKMEATGGSSTMYQKGTQIDDEPDFNPAEKMGDLEVPDDGNQKEFGGDISSICIAPFEDD